MDMYVIKVTYKIDVSIALPDIILNVVSTKPGFLKGGSNVGLHTEKGGHQEVQLWSQF